MSRYEHDVSDVWEGRLFVSNLRTAMDRECLREAGITHVVNAIGHVAEPQFPEELEYMVLRLGDSVAEDITGLIFTVADWIDEAHAGGGRVLVHCEKGISRSVSLAIGWMMLASRRDFEDLLRHVRDGRSIANPNVAFTCQLMDLHDMLTGQTKEPVLLELQPHGSHPELLLPTPVPLATTPFRDRDGCYLLLTPGNDDRILAVYAGAHASSMAVVALERAVAQRLKAIPGLKVVGQAGDRRPFLGMYRSLRSMSDTTTTTTTTNTSGGEVTY